jgi:hypothetical protein
MRTRVNIAVPSIVNCIMHPAGREHSITRRVPPVKASGENVTVQKVVKLGKIERNEPRRTDMRQ